MMKSEEDIGIPDQDWAQRFTEVRPLYVLGKDLPLLHCIDLIVGYRESPEARCRIGISVVV
jgi:hypothetical protein